MCGIAGFYSERSLADKESRIKAMTDIIEHRGPDDHGFHGDDHIAFGFRRLSIIDIDAGHQPLCNEDGTVWLIFNGEIYNYKALYNELIEKGHIFKSQSDSEVIVHAYEEWGTDFLHKIEGMFAIAIWDSITKKLLLTVDRTGIKPLYYSKIGSEIFFASEAKALFASGLVPCEADYSVLPYHMAFLTAPHPLTMFKDVKKLEPGHFLSIQNAEIEKHCYWDITFSEDKNRTLSDSEKTVQKLIDQAVESQSRADVPLGAFLSGGIDSSAVSYSLKQATGEAPETYFIKFRDEDLVHDVIMDESGYATQMAKDLGSKHHDITATSEGIDKLLPRLVWHMDEPVGDPAAITTYMVSKSARQSLTVLLSGVGGDEIFAGYPRHLAMLLMGKFLKLPKPLRIAIKSVGGLLPGGKNATFRNARKFLRSANNDPLSSYLGMLTYFSPEAQKDLFTEEFYNNWCKADLYEYHRNYYNRCKSSSILDKIQYVDFKTFLPCLNLTYTDRMSMAASIEVRVPLLDEALIENASTIPASLRIKNKVRKYIFKKSQEGRLPDDVIWRKKSGFGAPIQAWLKNEIKPLVEEFLNEDRLKEQGIFKPEAIKKLLAAEKKQEDYYANHIWQLLTFQIWHHTFIEKNITEYKPA